MGVEGMKKKKETIFKLFIIPLIIIMLIQAVISYGTVLFSGVPGLLQEYSVSLLAQTVENRKNIMENNMIRQWSSFQEESEMIMESYERFLQNERVETRDFLNDKSRQDAFLDTVAEECLSVLRKNTVTGAFVVLGNLDDSQEDEYRGIYFRDADPHTDVADYSDILMERGSSSLSRRLGIPLDSRWTTEFFFAPPGEKEADNFFYNPLKAANDWPDIGSRNMGYWSGLIELGTEEGYRMMTYSVPLLDQNNDAIGVIGMEISEKYMTELLPAKELDSGNSSGYMLARSREDGVLEPVVITGSIRTVFGDGENIGIRPEEKADPLWKIGDAPESGTFYGIPYELSLYNSNTPFSGDRWYLMGIQSGGSIFGMGKRLLKDMFLAVMAGLVFGLICCAFIAVMITRPIRRLVECIRGSRDSQMMDFKESRVAEVDELYDVVHKLTEYQRETQGHLREEKERYRIALESCSDILFDYDYGTGLMQMQNMNGGIREDGQEEKGCDTAPRQEYQTVAALDEIQGIRMAEGGTLKDFILLAHKEVRAECVVGGGTEGRRWSVLNGKVLYNAEGNRTHLIGSIRDIHELKLRELKEEEAYRHDAVTGLYSRNVGENILRQRLEWEKDGYLALLDLDHFREVNEQFGMVFGDALLEQFGMKLKELIRLGEEQEAVALRMGGDEILLYLPECTKEETAAFLEEFFVLTGRIYKNGNIFLQFSAGITKAKSDPGETGEDALNRLLLQAQKALGFAKQAAGGRRVFYEELTDEQKKKQEIRRGINEIANPDAADNMNMVSYVFRFFDRGTDIDSIMTVLLTRLGYYYGASDIVVTEAARDFHVIHCSWQWHDDETEWNREEISYLHAQEAAELTAAVQEPVMFGVDEETELKSLLCRIPRERSGYAIPMYDNGRLMGTVTFAARSREILWEEDVRLDLTEIAKILESNITRFKYDQASRAKSDFLARMSHEIRTPMNAIIGMTNIALESRKDPRRVGDCLGKIDQSSRYLLSLINDILDMSKIESGKLRLANAEFSMQGLMDSVNSIIAPQAQQKGVHYETKTEILEDRLAGDLLHLNQVLINLLGNAVKFTPSGGNVILKIAQEAHNQEEVKTFFCVEDTGIGISPENLERIFNAFEQAEMTTSQNYGGTGLGLAISDRLVRMMGGSIEVESEPGQGSRFCFSIVQRRSAGNPDGPGDSGAEAVSSDMLKGKRILLVEDNALNMEIAATVVEMRGMNAEKAENGREAVDMVAGHAPYYYDAVLMDIRMPVMDGLEAAAAIRNLERQDAGSLPIIAMSANAFDEDVRKSLEAGMNGHLAKPIDVDELLRVLAKVIRQEQSFSDFAPRS